MQALAHPCGFPIALRALVALFPLFGVYDGFMMNPCNIAASKAVYRELHAYIKIFGHFWTFLDILSKNVQKCLREGPGWDLPARSGNDGKDR